MLRNKISSDSDAMAELHRIHPWVPGAENIRPTQKTRDVKVKTIERIGKQYASESDFLFEQIFGIVLVPDADGKLHAARGCAPALVKAGRVFKANLFPYDLPRGTRHWVMWYPVCFNLDALGPMGADLNCWLLRMKPSDEAISADIEQELRTELEHDRFDFVWYLNPKMTVPNIFHVQVFWVSWEGARPDFSFAMPDLSREEACRQQVLAAERRLGGFPAVAQTDANILQTSSSHAQTSMVPVAVLDTSQDAQIARQLAAELWAPERAAPGAGATRAVGCIAAESRSVHSGGAESHSVYSGGASTYGHAQVSLDSEEARRQRLLAIERRLGRAPVAASTPGPLVQESSQTLVNLPSEEEQLARALRESAVEASIEMSIEERIQTAIQDSEERELAQALRESRDEAHRQRVLAIKKRLGTD